jgi:hypothetical protein
MSSLSILYFLHTLLIAFSNAPRGTWYFFPCFAFLSRETALRQAISMTHSSKASVKKYWRAFLAVSVVPFGRPPLLDVSCVVVLAGEVIFVLALFSGVKTGSSVTDSVVARAVNYLCFAAKTGDQTSVKPDTTV